MFSAVKTAMLVLLTVITVGANAPARAQGFIADLSDHLIAITTAFTGTQVLLFGLLPAPDGHVVAVIRGPDRQVTVRRKDRMGLVWLNGAECVFNEVPGYYAVAASGPLDQVGLPAELRRHGIGFENLSLKPADGAAPAKTAEFREALIRNKQNEGLFSPSIAPVRFVGDSMFRTTLYFPANVPPGNYLVEVFYFDQGRVTSAQQSALVITKIGMEAEIFDLSRQQPSLYAALSIALATAAGYAAALIFRR